MMRSFCLSFFLLLGNVVLAQLSEQKFLRPDAAFAPCVHWQWKSDHVNREGINLDLEAMAATGLSGGSIDLYATNPARLDSTRWNELVLHALQQADRLGLAFDLVLPTSFSHGSLQSHPEFAAQRLVWSEITVNGSPLVERLLPKPLSNPVFYQDVAVLAFPEGVVVDPINIKNISDLLQPDGRLTWNVPKGNWIIVRFGCTLVDSVSSGRLALDAFSQQATRHYFDAVLKPIIDLTAAYKGRSLTGISLMDPSNCFQNWTPHFREEFLRRAGYDLTPYLLAFTGRIVGNAQQVSRFRWDLQRVQSSMVAENHDGVLQTLLKPTGLQLNAKQSVMVPDLTSPLFLKTWSDSVSEKRIEFAFELLPFVADDEQTDTASVLNRNNPTLGKYTDCFSHLKRSSYVLQHASNVFPGACFLGEEAASMNASAWSLDCLSRETLMDSAFVKNHQLVLPGGRIYRFLTLPDTRVVSLPLLRKLKELLSDGLWLSASKPITWVGVLMPTEQAEWSALVNDIWSKLPAGIYRYGAGRLFNETSTKQVLEAIGWKPDYTLTSSVAGSNVFVKHLRIGMEEAWFLSNRRSLRDTILATFRTSGLQPEWWNPQTGEVRKIRIFRQLEEQTLVPLLLEPDESGFIVFRKKVDDAVYDGVVKDDVPLISADPNVFPDNMSRNVLSDKAVDRLPLMLLQKDGLLFRSKGLYTLIQPGLLSKKQPKMQLKNDLSVYVLAKSDTAWLPKSANDTTTWRCRFSLTPFDLLGNRLMLDLGSLSNDMADIFVNGKSAGTLWASPYRVEVTNLVGMGENSLEIRFLATKNIIPVRESFTLSAWKVLKF